MLRLPVHPHIRGVYVEEPPHRQPPIRSIPTYVGFTASPEASTRPGPVHPHIRGVYSGAAPLPQPAGRSIPTYVGFTARPTVGSSASTGPSPHTWGLLIDLIYQLLHVRSIPTYVGFTSSESRVTKIPSVHPHIRGVYKRVLGDIGCAPGPSPHTWGLHSDAWTERAGHRSIPTYVGFTPNGRSRSINSPVHPHIRGVYTEIKSKISRASSKTALLPAEKFKILFLVKIKSSAAAFQVHTIFRDQFPPGLHFEIALHL